MTTDAELRRWRDVGFSVWLSKDGHLRGIVSLGAVTAEEFEAAVGRRWPLKLRAIDPVKLREEVYRAIRPGMIADFGSDRGRYQPLKFYVGPRQKTGRMLAQGSVTEVGRWIEPMPVLL